jgi:hypothetical protein
MSWRKSARSSSNSQNCVEVARVPASRRIAARDSKQPAGPRLLFGASHWRRFLADIKKGRFDL